MDTLNDPLLSFWRSLGDLGFKLVIIGVIGEVAAAFIDFVSEKRCKVWHETWKSKLRLIELIAGGVLILGLAMEYRGHKRETQILDLYNAESYSNSVALASRVEAFRFENNRLEAQINEQNPLKKPVFAATAFVEFKTAISLPSNFDLHVKKSLLIFTNGSVVLDLQNISAFSDVCWMEFKQFAPMRNNSGTNSADIVLKNLNGFRLRLDLEPPPPLPFEIVGGYAIVTINTATKRFWIKPMKIEPASTFIVEGFASTNN